MIVSLMFTPSILVLGQSHTDTVRIRETQVWLHHSLICGLVAICTLSVSVFLSIKWVVLATS